MRSITLLCDWCEDSFEKDKGEYNRRIREGKEYFFCTRSCSAKWNNEHRGNKNFPIKKVCPCGKEFPSHTGKKASSHCSPSCASKFSVTKKRLEGNRKGGRNSVHSPETMVKVLKKRENWKYLELKSFLDFEKEEYEFELLVENNIFDLALTSRKILIEFDGSNHKYEVENDRKKDAVAKRNGWRIERVKIGDIKILRPSMIYKFIIKE